MPEEIQKTRVVYFHKNCADGVAAAGVCFLAFGNYAEYIPIDYYDKPDFAVCEEKEVYFVDFFPSKQMWIGLFESLPNEIFVLDHHRAAKELFGKLCHENFFSEAQIPRIIFVDNMSGAKLAQTLLFPGKVNHVIENISDADLFTHELEKSAEISLAMRYLAGNYPEVAASMIDYKAGFPEHLFQAGMGIKHCLMEQENIVKQQAHEISIFGKKGLIVNAVNNLFKTNVGHLLSKQSGTFGAVYDIFKNTEGKFVAKISFRGNHETEFKVLEIAEQLGGGGHDYAASAVVPLEDLILILESKM